MSQRTSHTPLETQLGNTGLPHLPPQDRAGVFPWLSQDFYNQSIVPFQAGACLICPEPGQAQKGQGDQESEPGPPESRADGRTRTSQRAKGEATNTTLVCTGTQTSGSSFSLCLWR